jgi:hypothetical protein
MVAKKEGATMICTQCDTELICRLKDYGGNYPPSLQWQNYDGAAHYKTTDGKKFECNVPDDDETTQTRIPTEPARTAGDGVVTATVSTTTKAQLLSISRLEEKIESINLGVEKIGEMVQAIFHYTVDEQLKKK